MKPISKDLLWKAIIIDELMECEAAVAWWLRALQTHYFGSNTVFNFFV